MATRTKKKTASRLATSGRTKATGHVAEQRMTLRASRAAAAAAGTKCSFGRISPDASPGWNVLTISGLPAGTRSISVWMTEWARPNNPHAGGAWYTTNSVQLYSNGTRCRVRFHLAWKRHLPTAAQIIYC